jgi:ornithine carbamoyltransferase
LTGAGRWGIAFYGHIPPYLCQKCMYKMYIDDTNILLQTTSELHLETDVTKAAYRADVLIGGAWSHVPEKIDNENIIEDFENFMITRQVRKLKWL